MTVRSSGDTLEFTQTSEISYVTFASDDSKPKEICREYCAIVQCAMCIQLE